MRFVVLTLIVFFAIDLWAWELDKKSIDLRVSILAEIEPNVPEEFVTMENGLRKTKFVEWILPIIERQNDQIQQIRKLILKLQRKKLFGMKLTNEETNFIKMQHLKYGGNNIDELIERIDVIPASLIIAQASIESGWGSSRFAQEGNNLFGIRTYDPDVPGLTPLENTNANFKVKSYLTVDDAVADYLFLLNTHYAYEDFRTARAYMTKRFKVSEHALADTLLNYSELGSQYIEMVHQHLTNIKRILNDIQ